MTADNRQIMQLAKSGMTADEIALSLGYPVETVQFVMLQDSKLNAKIDASDKNKLEKEFEAMEQLALEGVKLAAMGAELPSSQMSAIRYILDQRFGLKKPKVNNTLNVFSAEAFNALLSKVKERRKELEAKVTDIEAHVVAT